jgi:hypothetical protein
MSKLFMKYLLILEILNETVKWKAYNLVDQGFTYYKVLTVGGTLPKFLSKSLAYIGAVDLSTEEGQKIRTCTVSLPRPANPFSQTIVFFLGVCCTGPVGGGGGGGWFQCCVWYLVLLSPKSRLAACSSWNWGNIRQAWLTDTLPTMLPHKNTVFS